MADDSSSPPNGQRQICQICLRPLRAVALLLVATAAVAAAPPWAVSGQHYGSFNGSVSRDDFPMDFSFGASTSAYQWEGAAAEDGRTPNVWDTFAHAHAHAVNGDVAADGYHKYKEDIKLMKETGLDAYRFSISWSRLIPNGRGEINPKGVEYYNNLINELLDHGIQPHATIFQYDLPQILEDEYGGWLSPQIIGDFTAYADVCFREFGDRVTNWTTLNEPNALVSLGYDAGIGPPGRCSKPFGFANCSFGDSVNEPYIVARNCLLAHSSAVSLYRRKYQAKQQGLIGMNIFINNILPYTNSTEDIAAAKRAQAFYTGWFLNPLYYGDYPVVMKENAGSKLPKFSRSQSDYCKQFYHWGYGLRQVLEHLKQSYGHPPIYIHENGYRMHQDVVFDDGPRVEFLSEHLKNLLIALRNGSNTRGYFAWSLMDLYELLSVGDTYGLYYVDFADEDLKRYPRRSAIWYKDFLDGGRMETERFSDH
ncbi:beta-glucosidase 1-like [Triticum aestivum]|nr:beta-glucosidase 1-like [Triticum aestivum]